MTVEYPGNAAPAPTYVVNSTTVDAELLYSTEGYVQKGVTLEPGQGVLPTGTFLKQNTSTKRYEKTTTAGDVQCVLRHTIDTGLVSTAQVWQANVLYGGYLKYNLVYSANSTVTLTSVLAAQVNTVAGFFKF